MPSEPHSKSLPLTSEAGFVYVAATERMKHKQVKIGRTCNVAERMRRLSECKTIEDTYKEIISIPVSNTKEGERIVHTMLRKFKSKEGGTREVFMMDSDTAKKFFLYLMEQDSMITSEIEACIPENKLKIRFFSLIDESVQPQIKEKYIKKCPHGKRNPHCCIICRNNKVKGFVYAVWSKQAPEQVKIGKTTTNLKQRLIQLNCGLSEDDRYIELCRFPTSDSRKAEFSIHQMLHAFRPEKRREIFVIPKDFVPRIFDCLKEQLDTVIPSDLLIYVREEDRLTICELFDPTVEENFTHICKHGRHRIRCKECGGSSVCEHDRQRNVCKDCRGTSICEHGRVRSQCKDCGAACFCVHGRRMYICKECGGACFCVHGRRRSVCKDCRGTSICEHGRVRSQCKDCGAACFCVHGRVRCRCKDCGGASICKHGRRRDQCKECKALHKK